MRRVQQKTLRRRRIASLARPRQLRGVVLRRHPVRHAGTVERPVHLRRPRLPRLLQLRPRLRALALLAPPDAGSPLAGAARRNHCSAVRATPSFTGSENTGWGCGLSATPAFVEWPA